MKVRRRADAGVWEVVMELEGNIGHEMAGEWLATLVIRRIRECDIYIEIDRYIWIVKHVYVCVGRAGRVASVSVGGEGGALCVYICVYILSLLYIYTYILSIIYRHIYILHISISMSI